MTYRTAARYVLLAITLVLGALAPVRAVRAQWEGWLGSWPSLHFGACGGAGCFAGQNLCAVIDADADPTYCYER